MSSLLERLSDRFSSLEQQTKGSIAKRKKSFEAFRSMQFPTTQDEEWKYTPLSTILQHDYQINTPKAREVDVKTFDPETKGNGAALVVINGILDDNASRLPQGVHLQRQTQEEEIFHHTANAFKYLNHSLATAPIRIRIDAHVQLNYPLEIQFIHTENTDTFYNTRVEIEVGENSEVTFVEHHKNRSKNYTLSNYCCDVSVGAGAQWTHYKVQQDTEQSYLIDQTHASQGRDSTTKFITLSTGHKFIRNNLYVSLRGQNALCNMYGLSHIDGDQLVDHHTCVHHLVPNCESLELYKGGFSGNAHGVFNGKVLVAKDAQKTSGFQQNNNILLSPDARIYSKPQLEIFADDVRCSHGCTTGQMDEDALFYLKSRGIGSSEAKKMLLRAFFQDVLSKVSISEIRQSLEKKIC